MQYARIAVSVAFVASLFSTAFAYPVQPGGNGLAMRSTTIIPQYVPAIARRAGGADDANGPVPSVEIVNDEEAADEFDEDLVSEDADEDEDEDEDEDSEHWEGDGHAVDADGDHEGEDDYSPIQKRHEDIPAQPAEGASETDDEADISHLEDADFDSVEDSGETLDTNTDDIEDGGEVATADAEEEEEDASADFEEEAADEVEEDDADLDEEEDESADFEEEESADFEEEGAEAMDASDEIEDDSADFDELEDDADLVEDFEGDETADGTDDAMLPEEDAIVPQFE